MAFEEFGGGIYSMIAEFLHRMGPYEAPCLDVGGYTGPYARLFPKPYFIFDNHSGPNEQPGVFQYFGWVRDGNLDGLDPSMTFKTVLSTECLEHVDDPIRCFEDMAARLEVGGKMVCTSPARWGYHPSPKDCWRIQKDGWEYMANRSGIEITALEFPDHGGDLGGFFAGVKR